MEKHQLLIISCLFFLLLIGDLPHGSAFNKATLKSVSRFFLIIRKTLLNFLAPPGSCGLRFQVPNTCQQDPSLTASYGLTLSKKAITEFWERLCFYWCWECCPDFWSSFHRQLQLLHAEGDLRAARVCGQHHEREGQLRRQHRSVWVLDRFCQWNINFFHFSINFLPTVVVVCIIIIF